MEERAPYMPQNKVARVVVEGQALNRRVLIHTDAISDVDHLGQSYDEFQPGFDSLVAAIGCFNQTPRTVQDGLYEALIPACGSMPSIVVEYLVTGDVAIVRSLLRAQGKRKGQPVLFNNSR